MVHKAQTVWGLTGGLELIPLLAILKSEGKRTAV